MYNIICMEFYKLKRLKSFKIMLLALLSISLFFCLSLVYQGKNTNGMVGFTDAIWDNGLMMIFCSIFAGLFIGSDFTNKTINMQVSSGQKRDNVLIGKSVVFFVASSLIILIYPIMSAIIDTIYMGWGSPFTIDTVFYILRVVFLSVILSIGTSSFFVLFAFLFKDTGKTIGVSVVFGILASIILEFSSNYHPILKTIYQFSTFNQSKFITNVGMTTTEIITACLSGVFTILIILSITYLVFRRSELK